MDSDQIARIGYNLLAPFYDFFLGSDSKIGLHMRQDIARRLELRKGARILEVSVGTGANLPFIYKKIGRTGKIFGLDISEGMLAKCRENIVKKGIPAQLVLGNANNLPYKDNSFDAVLHFGAINFFSNKRKAISEMVRVAKPGAKIVIGDERLPLMRSTEPPVNLIPKNAVNLGVSEEKLIFQGFWMLELRKLRKAEK